MWWRGASGVPRRPARIGVEIRLGSRSAGPATDALCHRADGSYTPPARSRQAGGARAQQPRLCRREAGNARGLRRKQVRVPVGPHDALRGVGVRRQEQVADLVGDGAGQDVTERDAVLVGEAFDAVERGCRRACRACRPRGSAPPRKPLRRDRTGPWPSSRRSRSARDRAPRPRRRPRRSRRRRPGRCRRRPTGLGEAAANQALRVLEHDGHDRVRWAGQGRGRPHRIEPHTTAATSACPSHVAPSPAPEGPRSGGMREGGRKG